MPFVDWVIGVILYKYLLVIHIFFFKNWTAESMEEIAYILS
jgi:hypothetical protein